MSESGKCQSPFRSGMEKRQQAAFLLFLRVDRKRPPAYVPRTFKGASRVPWESVAQSVEQLTFNQ
jgi:hypothetical protein